MNSTFDISERKNIQVRLENVENKMKRLTNILEKKVKQRGLNLNSSVITYSGQPVSNYLPESNAFIQSNPSCSELKGVTPKSPTIMKIDIERKCKEELLNATKHANRVNDHALQRGSPGQATKLHSPTSPRVSSTLKIPPSLLPDRYHRNDLPCTIEHGVNGHYLSWICPMEQLNYEYYLPVFFDGLQCSEPILSFIARQGVEDMLYWGRHYPDKIKACIKDIIRPIRNALLKYNIDITIAVLRSIQQIIQSHCGPNLIPYTKHFLTPLLIFIDHNKNIGDNIDYSQRKQNDIGEMIRNTLEMLEDYGGPNALKAIKFSIPTCKFKFIRRYYDH